MEAKKIILWLYYFAIGLMLASLPFSNYLMSVSQFGLVGVFILHGIKKQEVDDFFRNHKTPCEHGTADPGGITLDLEIAGA